MFVIMLRHATRSNHGLGDCPLSAVGFMQAELLATLMGGDGPLPVPSKIFSSPKKRALQTLEPTATSVRVVIEQDNRLDERRQSESAMEFSDRVQSFLDELSMSIDGPSSTDQDNGCVLFCTHFDWLELAVVLLDGELSELERSGSWAAGEFRVFQIIGGTWKFVGGGITPSHKV